MATAIFYERNPGYLNRLAKAFEEELGSVETVRLSSLTMFTERGSTAILKKNGEQGKFNSVFLLAGQKNSEFIEPLLDCFDVSGTYCQCRPNSYYLYANEPYSHSLLSSFNFPLPETVFSSSLKSLKGKEGEFSYPLLLKLYINGRAVHKFLVETSRSLKWILKSRKTHYDMIEVREFFESDLLHCASINGKVYCARRRLKDGEFVPLEKGKYVKLSGKENETVELALKASGLDAGTVKLCGGKILRVKPDINFLGFNKVTGENLFSELAKLYRQKEGHHG